MIRVLFSSSRPRVRSSNNNKLNNARTCTAIDASLVPVPVVNRYSVLSVQTSLSFTYNSSNTCSIEANIGTLCHDRQAMRYFLRMEL